MANQFNFKKEWEKTKKQLLEFQKEAIKIAKKGEDEFVNLSQKSKLHLDITAAGLKKERLFYLIGKEYVKAKNPSEPTASLKKLITELKNLEKEQRSLKTKLRRKPKKK